jgi:hypothetical protein
MPSRKNPRDRRQTGKQEVPEAFGGWEGLPDEVMERIGKRMDPPTLSQLASASSRSTAIANGAVARDRRSIKKRAKAAYNKEGGTKLRDLERELVQRNPHAIEETKRTQRQEARRSNARMKAHLDASTPGTARHAGIQELAERTGYYLPMEQRGYPATRIAGEIAKEHIDRKPAKYGLANGMEHSEQRLVRLKAPKRKNAAASK